MALSRYDEIFLGIMKEKGHIMPFLDAVFGFLYRCTDFYRIQENPTDKLGFPQGLAESCVLKVLHKWEEIARQDDDYYYKKRIGSEGDVTSGIKEVLVTTSPSEPDANTENTKKIESKDSSMEKNCSNKDVAGDSYNGAVLDNYRWSQTIGDVDIQVPVPVHITKARDVQVKVTAVHISVAVKDKDSGDWTLLMEGDLSWRNNKDESLWSLEPGKHVQVHLEKSQERWWDSLLVSEPKIDLSKIDASRPMDDLAQDEQMKIQELMWNQERKQQGLPTSDQLNTEKILKEAWNKEGSPFLGTEYDPSVIHFGNVCTNETEECEEPA